MLIATTDLIDRTGERTIQQQEKRSSFFRLNDLRAAAVDWPVSPDLLRPAKRRKPAVPLHAWCTQKPITGRNKSRARFTVS